MRRAVRLLLLALVFYCLSYAGMRASGRIRPFYDQGGFEMDFDDRPAIVFLPLMVVEAAWHDKHTPPPTGG